MQLSRSFFIQFLRGHRRNRREFEQKAAKETKISVQNLATKVRSGVVISAVCQLLGSKRRSDRSRQREFEQKVAKEAKFWVQILRGPSSLRTRDFSTAASRSAQSAALTEVGKREFEQKVAKEAKFWVQILRGPKFAPNS